MVSFVITKRLLTHTTSCTNMVSLRASLRILCRDFFNVSMSKTLLLEKVKTMEVTTYTSKLTQDLQMVGLMQRFLFPVPRT